MAIMAGEVSITAMTKDEAPTVFADEKRLKGKSIPNYALLVRVEKGPECLRVNVVAVQIESVWNGMPRGSTRWPIGGGRYRWGGKPSGLT